MKYLIKQAVLIPLLFFIPVFISGFLVDGYDLIRQHASEITLTDNNLAKNILSTGAILTGVSCILFSIGLIYSKKKANIFSSILLTFFGLSMISNGLYPMGNPMHGLYGVGLTLMILPFVACYEWKGTRINVNFFSITIVLGLLIFFYFWLILVGLDPINYKGLTQRIASIFIFGWIAYMAYEVNKTLPNTM